MLRHIANGYVFLDQLTGNTNQIKTNYDPITIQQDSDGGKNEE